MHTIKLNFKQFSASIDLENIVVDENGALTKSIAALCSPPIYPSHERTRYHILGKVSICGQSADGVIQLEQGKIFSITFIFDLIEFFEYSILESKIIKSCEKCWNLKFTSDNHSTALLNSCEWGDAIFFYDAKQGDLSLEIKFTNG